MTCVLMDRSCAWIIYYNLGNKVIYKSILLSAASSPISLLRWHHTLPAGHKWSAYQIIENQTEIHLSEDPSSLDNNGDLQKKSLMQLIYPVSSSSRTGLHSKIFCSLRSSEVVVLTPFTKYAGLQHQVNIKPVTWQNPLNPCPRFWMFYAFWRKTEQSAQSFRLKYCWGTEKRLFLQHSSVKVAWRNWQMSQKNVDVLNCDL